VVYFPVLQSVHLFDPAKRPEPEVKSLAYVGITRARYELFIPYVNKNDLISKLLGCL
jgi:superfamily I DNA/RNA helicase